MSFAKTDFHRISNEGQPAGVNGAMLSIRLDVALTSPDTASANDVCPVVSDSDVIVRYSASDLSGFVDAGFDRHLLATDRRAKLHVNVAVEQLRSGNPLYDREMWKLIDSRRFPTIVAELHRFEPGDAPGRYIAGSDITLAGRQRRYTGPLTFKRGGDRFEVGGELRVDMRDFGLHPPRYPMFSVEPQVNVRWRLTAPAQR